MFRGHSFFLCIEANNVTKVTLDVLCSVCTVCLTPYFHCSVSSAGSMDSSLKRKRLDTNSKEPSNKK